MTLLSGLQGQRAANSEFQLSVKNNLEIREQSEAKVGYLDR